MICLIKHSPHSLPGIFNLLGQYVSIPSNRSTASISCHLQLVKLRYFGMSATCAEKVTNSAIKKYVNDIKPGHGGHRHHTCQAI